MSDIVSLCVVGIFALLNVLCWLISGNVLNAFAAGACLGSFILAAIMVTA